MAVNDLPEILKPINDISFKKVFLSKDITKSFINEVFKEEKVEEIESIVADASDTADYAQGKTIVTDIFCKSKNGQEFIVEMQVASYPGFMKRVVYYGARAYTNMVVRGKSYETAQPVYIIVVCNFNMFAEEDWFSHHKTVSVTRLEKNVGQILRQDSIKTSVPIFEYIVLQLGKYERDPNIQLENMDRINLWMIYFTEGNRLTDSERAAIREKCPSIDRAIDILRRVNFSAIELKAYNDSEDKRRIEQDLATAQKAHEEELSKAKEELSKVKESNRKMEEELSKAKESKRKEKESKRKMKEDLEAMLQAAQAVEGNDAFSSLISEKLARYNDQD